MDSSVTVNPALNVTAPLKVPPEAALTVSATSKLLKAITITSSEAANADKLVISLPFVAV